MTCTVLGAVSILATAGLLVATPYVNGTLAPLVTWLSCSIGFGSLIYPWWSGYRRALRQEAEQGERAERAEHAEKSMSG